MKVRFRNKLESVVRREEQLWPDGGRPSNTFLPPHAVRGGKATQTYSFWGLGLNSNFFIPSRWSPACFRVQKKGTGRRAERRRWAWPNSAKARSKVQGRVQMGLPTQKGKRGPGQQAPRGAQGAQGGGTQTPTLTGLGVENAQRTNIGILKMIRKGYGVVFGEEGWSLGLIWS